MESEEKSKMMDFLGKAADHLERVVKSGNQDYMEIAQLYYVELSSNIFEDEGRPLIGCRSGC